MICFFNDGQMKCKNDHSICNCNVIWRNMKLSLHGVLHVLIQIVKLNRRLQLLEEENKERSKREVILYSATVAFWLINTWIWFRRWVGTKLSLPKHWKPKQFLVTGATITIWASTCLGLKVNTGNYNIISKVPKHNPQCFYSKLNVEIWHSQCFTLANIGNVEYIYLSDKFLQWQTVL